MLSALIGVTTTYQILVSWCFGLGIHLMSSPLLNALTPEDFDNALTIKAPINAVLISMGQATVTRIAEVKVTPQGDLIRFPDLPPQARDIRIYANKAEVLRVAQGITTRSNLKVELLDQQISELERLSNQTLELQHTLIAPQAEQVLLNQLQTLLSSGRSDPRSLVTLNDRNLKTWSAFQKLILDRYESLQRVLAEKQQALSSITQKYQIHWNETSSLLQKAQQRQVLEVFALIRSSQSRKVKVSITYTAPNAQWTPVHELHIDVNQGKVKRAFGVQVSQNSSEDWNEVQIQVSTAKTQHILTRPVLQTWTLSENRMFLPKVYAKRTPQVTPLFAAPSSLHKSHQASQNRFENLKKRIHRIQELSPQVAHGNSDLARVVGSTSISSYGQSALSSGGKSSSVGSLLSKKRPQQQPRYSPNVNIPQPAPPRRESYSSYSNAPTRRTYESASSPMPASEAMSLDDGVSSTRHQPSSSVGISINDQVIYQSQNQAHRYLFKAPNRVSIKSGSTPIVVPIEVVSSPVDLYYEVTPALSPHSYLTGTVKHLGSKPILGGSATLFSGGAFVGESTLTTIPVGEEWTVPLGADPDLRVKRHVEVKTKTEGVFSKDEISTYLVKIQVANYKQRSIRVKVYDVLPMSNHEKIEVTLLKLTPQSEKQKSGQVHTEVSDQGGVVWDLTLKANARKELTLQYQIKRPEGWRIYQR